MFKEDAVFGAMVGLAMHEGSPGFLEKILTESCLRVWIEEFQLLKVLRHHSQALLSVSQSPDQQLEDSGNVI